MTIFFYKQVRAIHFHAQIRRTETDLQMRRSFTPTSWKNGLPTFMNTSIPSLAGFVSCTGAAWSRSELEVGRSYYRQKKYGKALKQPGRLGGTGA